MGAFLPGFFGGALATITGSDGLFNFTDSGAPGHSDTVTITNANPVAVTITWGDPVDTDFHKPADTALGAYETKNFTATDVHSPADGDSDEEVANTVAVGGVTVATFYTTYQWTT